MASQTSRLGLTLPGNTDSLDISILNNNFTLIDAIFLKIYPVGAIYISTTNTNPGSLFGGTWTAIENRFLVAAGGSFAAGSTGGSAQQTVSFNGITQGHILTTQELPPHSHTFTAHGEITGGTHNHRYSGTTENATPGSSGSTITVAPGSGGGTITTTASASHHHIYGGSTDDETPSMTFKGTNGESTSVVGNGTAHSHNYNITTTVSTLPPYTAVFVWQRTA